MKKRSAYVHHIALLVKVLMYIDQHLDEELSLENLARIACISSFYFHRLFRAYMGETLQEYVRRLRMQIAAGKLCYSASSITEIGLEAGYQTSSSFNKAFRQVMQTTPSRYRQKMRPLALTCLRNTFLRKESGIMLKPEYIQRKEERVLFVRKMGDYRYTPQEAFESLKSFLLSHELMANVAKYYGMSLDNPHVVEAAKCRFDACVVLREPCKPQGEVGEKKLPSGRYALFVHRGPYSSLSQTFDQIFAIWYPNTSEKLADAPPFCEFVDLFDETIEDSKRITKIYIPLVSR